MQIHPYEDSVHRVQVIQLWELVFAYTAAHNDPAFTIDQKLCAKDGLFFVATREDTVMGTAGCCKVNLQIVTSNQTTIGFYEKLGYQVEPRISMGKLLDNKFPKTLLND
jgi:hypothetical protein